MEHLIFFERQIPKIGMIPCIIMIINIFLKKIWVNSIYLYTWCRFSKSWCCYSFVMLQQTSPNIMLHISFVFLDQYVLSKICVLHICRKWVQMCHYVPNCHVIIEESQFCQCYVLCCHHLNLFLGLLIYLRTSLH
jgi:hypothetical protein